MPGYAALDVELLTAPPLPGEWSALDNVRHLLFAEDLYLNRWCLRNDKPWCAQGLLPAFLADQPGYTRVGSQPSDDLEAVLAAWAELHAETWRYVDTLTPEALRRDTRQP